MKKLVLTLALLLPLTVAIAQEDGEPKFLFEGADISLSGFGGPIIEFSMIEGDFAVLNGGGGAVLFNQSFFIGGYGLGLSTNHMRPDLIDITGIERPRVSFGHGGFWLGYIHNPKNAIHFGASAKLGWGQISVYDEFFNYAEFDNFSGRDNIFAVNPQIEIEANFTSWMKVNIGVGYRLVAGIDKQYSLNGEVMNYYDSKQYNTPYANVSLMFGWFNKY